MKTRFTERMNRAFRECPGVTVAEMPRSERGIGQVVVKPEVAKLAFDFLRRRFHVEEKEFVEQTGELRFRITPIVRRMSGLPRVKYEKPEQFELPL